MALGCCAQDAACREFALRRAVQLDPRSAQVTSKAVKNFNSRAQYGVVSWATRGVAKQRCLDDNSLDESDHKGRRTRSVYSLSCDITGLCSALLSAVIGTSLFVVSMTPGVEASCCVPSNCF